MKCTTPLARYGGATAHDPVSCIDSVDAWRGRGHALGSKVHRTKCGRSGEMETLRLRCGWGHERWATGTHQLHDILRLGDYPQS